MLKKLFITIGWMRFGQNVRSGGSKLLKMLPSYDSPILVAGCQRSGTTILTKILSKNSGIKSYEFGYDEELDAALVLSGRIKKEIDGRYCFQTTYLNNSYKEYYDHSNYKLIWVVRSPKSVVYSMVYNWTTFALNELYEHCGKQYASEKDKLEIDQRKNKSLSKIKKACYSYFAKSKQLLELKEKLSEDKLLIVEYESIVNNASNEIQRINSFLNIQNRNKASELMNRESLSKASRLSNREVEIIDSICKDSYSKMKKVVK